MNNSKINNKQVMITIIILLSIILIIITYFYLDTKNELDYYKSIDLIKCTVFKINGTKTPILRVLSNATDYEILHRELNPELSINLSLFNINQSIIKYDNTIVTTWVFRSKNDTSYKVVIRLFHSMLDYLIGNDDPRAYIYYCSNNQLRIYAGSNKYKLANSLAYQISDLSNYCYREWSD